MRYGIFPSSMLSLGDQGLSPSALHFVSILYSISLSPSFGLPAQVSHRCTPSTRVSKTTDSDSDPQGTDLESGVEPGRSACQGEIVSVGPVYRWYSWPSLAFVRSRVSAPCAALSPLCRT